MNKLLFVLCMILFGCQEKEIHNIPLLSLINDINSKMKGDVVKKLFVDKYGLDYDHIDGVQNGAQTRVYHFNGGNILENKTEKWTAHTYKDNLIYVFIFFSETRGEEVDLLIKKLTSEIEKQFNSKAKSSENRNTWVFEKKDLDSFRVELIKGGSISSPRIMLSIIIQSINPQLY